MVVAAGRYPRRTSVHIYLRFSHLRYSIFLTVAVISSPNAEAIFRNVESEGLAFPRSISKIRRTLTIAISASSTYVIPSNTRRLCMASNKSAMQYIAVLMQI